MRFGPALNAGKPCGILALALLAMLSALIFWSCASTSPLAEAARKEMEEQKKAAGAPPKAASGPVSPPGKDAPGQPGEAAPPQEAAVIDKKPQKYGIYIYRDGKFIPLPTVNVNYSGVWFPISLTSKKLAANYVSAEDLKDLQTFREDDLLCIHYKNAAKRSWFYYPLTRFARSDFPGSIESEIWERPAGHYLGFSAIGPPQALKGLFGKTLEDGYRFDQQRIKPEDIVYQDSAILFARLAPAPGLAISRYIITSRSVSFGEVKDYQDLLSQVADEGVVLDLAQAAAMENFEGLRDSIERYNEESSVRYILHQKEFTLKKNQIIDTGIMVNEPSHIRFISDADFNIVLRPGEWDDQGGWMPADQPFGKEGRELPLFKGTFAHPVQYRHFALRYERTTLGTQVRLQGISDGAKVTIIYSPMFCYQDSYHNHVKQGYEYHNQGRYAEAVAEYQAALKELPEYPYALNNLAWLYATATDPAFKDPKKALDLAVEAARFRPVKPYILDTLSLSWYLNGDIEKAIEFQQAASTAVADSESYSQVYADRLNQYREVKERLAKAQRAEEDLKYKDALNELEKALQIMPQSIDALSRMAWICVTARDKAFIDPKKALELAQKAYSIAPDSALACDTLAEALFVTGNREKALEMARKAWYLIPLSDYYKSRAEHFAARKK